MVASNLANIVVVEQLHRYRRSRRCHLVAAYFISAAVDGVEQRLGEVHAGAEELHLLAESHRRDAAGDAVVVTPVGPHQVVVLVLDRRGVAADADAELLERRWQMLRPQHGHVGLGRRPEVHQGVQHAVAGARHQRPAVEVHAADAFGRPVRVAAEQRVVLRRAEEAHDAQLLDQLVDQLLRPALVELALGNVALEVDVEEG
jgi:hypothetical protein